MKQKKSEKATYCMIPSMWHSRKGKTMQKMRKTSGCQSLAEGAWIGRASSPLGQWNESVWYYNSGHVSLYIYQNPQNIQHQKWTL